MKRHKRTSNRFDMQKAKARAMDRKHRDIINALHRAGFTVQRGPDFSLQIVPIPALLRCYQSLWMNNPLWLIGIPGLPNAHDDPQAARAAALDLCFDYDRNRIDAMRSSVESIAA